MLGLGFFEILIILIVAIIFLGPDKLPQAIVEIVKLFRIIKRTIHDARETFDKELQLDKLTQEAKEYHQSFQHHIDDITKDIQLQEIETMFDEYKELPEQIQADSHQIDSSKESKSTSIQRSKKTAESKTSAKATPNSAKQAKQTKSKTIPQSTKSSQESATKKVPTKPKKLSKSNIAGTKVHNV